MARLTNASSYDLALTFSQLFIIYLTNIVRKKADMIISQANYHAGGGAFDTEEHWMEVDGAHQALIILESPEWLEVIKRIAYHLELHMTGIKTYEGLPPFGPSQDCEAWAKCLVRVAMMVPIDHHTDYERQSFLEAGNYKKVATEGAYLQRVAPPPMIEGPKPRTLLDLVAATEDVASQSFAPIIASTVEDFKQLAPGGLLD